MHAFPQFSMSVAEILSGKWSLQMGMHKGTGGVKLERTGPRFWYKNVGLKNGFEIGFRNGFGFLTLEKVRKWVVCTGLSKRNGAKLRESFCPAAASHSRPRQAVD